MTREKAGDPRPAIDARYTSEDDFLRKFRAAAEEAVRQRWMLPEDLPVALREAKKEWQAVAGLPDPK